MEVIINIALLSYFFSPECYNGVIRYIEDLASGLSSKGHHIDVIAGSRKAYSSTVTRDGYMIHYVPNNKASSKYLASLEYFKTSIRMRNKLEYIHRYQPFEIIEFHNTAFPALWTLTRKLRSPRPKFIMRVSTPSAIMAIIAPDSVVPFRAGMIFETYQARRADACIGNSQENLKICTNTYRLPTHMPKRVILHSLPSGISPRHIPGPPDGKNILFVGRIEERKGFDVLAKAWPIVVAAIPSATLTVIGEDQAWRGGRSFLAYSLEGMSNTAKSKIRYLGFVSDDQRDHYYQKCNLFVAPSRYESFGLVLLEAMRYGKPVVSCSVGGIPEVVTHLKTGLLVPPDKPSELAHAMIKLLNDEYLRLQMGVSAVQDVISRFTLKRCVRETEAFYQSVLAASS
jgi:glycosyltransferase involved in cell wall biosynthesis